MAAALGVGGGNESWRDCVSWLTRCGAIRPDHKANWPEATIADLAYTLRDGVVLCSLLNEIDPKCIDMKDVNQKPQMAQVKINLFYYRLFNMYF
jgi:guanine nucleotide exchange factor VAV